MPTINNVQYSGSKSINLVGQNTQQGSVLRFAQTSSANPLDSTSNGLYINTSNELIFSSQGTTTTISTDGGGAGSLDAAYGDGATITVDGGPIILNDSTAGAANVIDINKSGAGSGNLLDVDITAAFTGNVIDINYGTGVAAQGILFTSTTDARTGSDIKFTDTSTATHNNIEINAAGSGAATAFAYTNSYNGSPAGNAISLTFDNADGLSTGGILITRGTGVRTDNAIAIADNSTGNVSIVDINITGAYTGDVLDINFSAAATGNGILITTGSNLAGNAIQIVTANERTAPVVLITSAGTDGGTDDHIFDINVSGLLNSNVLDIVYSVGASDGNAIYIDMATNLAGGALNIAATGTRTDSLIDITTGDDGSVDGSVMFVDNTAVHTGSLVTLTTSAAATTGSLLHLNLDAGVAYKAITFDHAGARTVATILATFDGTFGATGGGTFLDANITMTGASASPFIDIDLTGAYTGNIFDVLIGASLATGDVIKIDLGATATGSQAMVLASGAMLRSTSFIDITDAGTSSGSLIDINLTGAITGTIINIDVDEAVTGNIIDIDIGAFAATGDMLSINLGATATTAQAIVIASGAMTRSTALIEIGDAGTSSGATFDINHTGVTTGIWFDLDATAATTGNVFDFATSAASTGTIFAINMTNAVAAKGMLWTTAGARTENLFTFTESSSGAVDLFEINNAGTSSGMVFDINVSTAFTGNVLDIVYSSTAISGHAVHVDMATNLAGNAILIDAANIRTAPIIYIANAATDGGTDDHVLFINQTGLLDSNLVQLTFATAASTGEAISISMDTNVAGRAIFISSAGTGVSGEGNAIDVTHTGVLVAGADVVTLQATGAVSSTSNILALESSGAAVAGSFALYIDVANDMEAIKVDSGTVTFDESLSIGTTLAVTGATTLSSTLSYRELTEAVTATNVITAAESGTTFFLNAIGGFTSTLPAPAAGLRFKFVVKTAPTTAYIITTNAGADVLYGLTVERAGTAGVAGAARDTVNFVASQAIIGDTYEFTCDGTNWYMKGIVDVAAACTFSVA